MKRLVFTIFLVGVFTSYVFADCPPSAQALCDYYDQGSTATAYCTQEACFDMSFGVESRVVLADESANTWFLWHETSALMTPAGDFPCVLSDQQNKARTRTRVDNSSIICKAILKTPEHLYDEHFANNPATQCIGWLECKEY